MHNPLTLEREDVFRPVMRPGEEAADKHSAGPGPGLMEGGGASGQTDLGSSPLPDSLSWRQGGSSSIREILKSVLDPKSTLKTFFDYN